MLNAINTKLLIAILAVLGGIGALLVHQHEVNAKSAEAAAKTAAILQQQQQRTNEIDERDRQLRAKVAEEHKKHNMNAAGESKTWATYVP